MINPILSVIVYCIQTHAYIASKFLDFSKISKTKILEKIWVQIFNPPPPGEGGIKNEVIEKPLGELKLQNMYFRTHKNKTKSKRWDL